MNRDQLLEMIETQKELIETALMLSNLRCGHDPNY